MVTADYSGLELRVHAALHDEEMSQAFREGRDLHDETQRRLKLTDRRLAKNLNFGLTFGAGASNLYDLLRPDLPDLTFQEAASLRARWHDAWKGTSDHIQMAYDDKLPREIVGPRGFFAVIGDMRNTASPMLNYPVQATAAIGAKLALVEIQRAGLHERLMLANHDEFVLGEFQSKQEAQEAGDVLVRCMESGMNEAMEEMGEIRELNEVPIEVECVVSHAWDKP